MGPGEGARVKRKALGAIAAQAAQAAVSLALQILVARLLGIADYGRFAILYGVIVLASGVVTGLVGDALIVLDRADRRIRAGLEVWLAIAAATSAALAAAVAAASGFASPAEAGLFALAMIAFVVEEIVRRLLMAGYAFPRVIAADLTGFVVSLAVLAGAAAVQALSLGAFLGAIAAGQTIGAIVGWRLVPRSERVLVGWRGANLRTVWGYGAWRGLQQTLRPAMLTGVRVVVLAATGAAAVGMLEAARTYTSPLLLVVGGLSSFLFVRFADHRREGRFGSLREADRVVVVLVGATVLMSAVALGLGPWLGPLAFGVAFDPTMLVAWLVFGLSVAVVTPYGALSAVAGRQRVVFMVRLSDTLLGLVLTVVIVLVGGSPALIPFALAAASALGGAALRWIAANTPSAP
ncbi:O-antigen/teichoic acid export membrane protein [Microbacterium sp. AG790]|nr:O-antigen/teichoic acid export membrane protein [Microbacterium sp. AG790]